MEILQYFLFACLIALSFSDSSSYVEAAGYKNYTVGDYLGWYDTLLKPTVNYQKWVVGKNFSLGDLLMFNTDSNHSVVQTYNFTTYKHCDYDNADTDDTTQWSQTEPSATTPRPITVSVPLLKEGMTYFFSGDYDGEQCKHGQRFKINVAHGLGLPESLKSPSAQAPAPNLDEDSTPNEPTTVSSNFDHPKDITDDDNDDNDDNNKTSGSRCLKMSMKLSWILVLLGVWVSY